MHKSDIVKDLIRPSDHKKVSNSRGENGSQRTYN